MKLLCGIEMVRLWARRDPGFATGVKRAEAALQNVKKTMGELDNHSREERAVDKLKIYSPTLWLVEPKMRLLISCFSISATSTKRSVSIRSAFDPFLLTPGQLHAISAWRIHV